MSKPSQTKTFVALLKSSRLPLSQPAATRSSIIQVYISDDEYEAMKINETTTSAKVLQGLSNAKAGDRIRTAGGKILSLDETVCGKGTNLFLTPASEIQRFIRQKMSRTSSDTHSKSEHVSARNRSDAGGHPSTSGSHGASASSSVQSQDIIKRLDEIHSEMNQIKKIMKTLVKRQDEMEQKCYKIDESEYKEPLWTAIAKFFCLSLKREISDTQLSRIVEGIVTTDQREYKFVSAVKWCRQKFNTFKSEERRKRKFVRDDGSSSRPGELHKRFQSWLNTTYHDGKPSDDQIAIIMDKDEEVYPAHPALTQETESSQEL